MRLSLSALLLTLFFAGCASTPESQFYVLQPRTWKAPVAKTAAEPIAIGLCPVTLPGAKARLGADCRLSGRDGDGVTHTASHERPVGTDYTNIVQTMSALVDDLGRELAEKIGELSN